jgi:ABC-type dipeptide/oligopeptide/nickel transport system permease component
MLRRVFQRFLLTLPALWLVLTLVFLMIHIVPGDPDCHRYSRGQSADRAVGGLSFVRLR